jgi:hypothetical protein
VVLVLDERKLWLYAVRLLLIALFSSDMQRQRSTVQCAYVAFHYTLLVAMLTMCA